MECYKAIPELVRRQGIGAVFGMLGAANAPWVAHGAELGAFRFIKTRHEETSVHAAIGYSRASGDLGVCTVTRGPGFANSLNGLIVAAYGHVPVLMIVSQSPVDPTKAGYTEQNVDQEGFSALLGAGFHHVVSPDQLEDRFWKAVRLACLMGRPQVLSLADGLLEDTVELSTEVPSLEATLAPDAGTVREVVDLLESASQPLILAGQGAVLADCHSELVELAELTGARVAATLRAHRFFSGHPQDLGLAGTWAPPILRSYFQKSDVVVAFGASLNDKTTDRRQLFGGASIAQCEVNENRPVRASRPELALLGDARLTAQALIDQWKARGLERRPAPDAPPPHSRVKASVLEVSMNHDPDRGLDLRQVYAAMDDQLPEDRIVVTDSGRSLGTLPAIITARDARSWLVGRGYGTVGLGLGTAIGAAVAQPERPVTLFCGDGGFMMALAALDTVRMSGLDLTVVIMNDEQLGSEVQHLRRFSLPLDVIRQPLPDIGELAHTFGGFGQTVRTVEDLAELKVPRGGLHLIDARLDPEVSGHAVLG